MNQLRIFFLFALLVLFSSVQLSAQKGKRIEFKADDIRFDEHLGKKAKRLIGNVSFVHEGLVMTCDSAYQYAGSNTVDAFGNVVINQGDTAHAYGDELFYDGDSRQFELKNNVRLETKKATLKTHYLHHDRNIKISSYLSGGVIRVDESNLDLTSVKGYYHHSDGNFYFRDSVLLVTPDVTIEADSLLYNVHSEITYFEGPTCITTAENSVFCEDGYYDKVSGKSEYEKNARLDNAEQTVYGDYMNFDKLTGIGLIKGNVTIEDTSENMTIDGQRAQFYELQDSAMIFGNPLMSKLMDEDTLFMHADTFIVHRNADSSDSRIIWAQNQVKFFKEDLQGKCDTLIYPITDSIIHMYGSPILWSFENQITGDYISLILKDEKIDHLYVESNAFIVSEVDSIRFNQIRGKEMTGYFIENELRKVDVNGNGQTIYYAQDDNDKFIGVNRGESSDLRIMVKDNKVDKIIMLNDPDATLYPLRELQASELKLKGFTWQTEYRPMNKMDVFIWNRESLVDYSSEDPAPKELD